MFNKQLVTCIKVAGKVLKEQKDKVFLPFGAEYSIFLKNLNSLRVAVRLEIDGKSVTDGQDLIIQPNSSIDIERFIKNGNLHSGNKFKFIERTGKVEAHRGVQAEDGLLRVEFQFEKAKPRVETVVVKTVHEHVHHDYWGWPYYRGGYCGSPVYYGGGCHGIIGNSSGGLLGGGSGCDVSYSASAGVNSMSGGGAGEATSYTLTSSNSGGAQGAVVQSANFNAPVHAFVNNVSTPTPVSGGSRTLLRSKKSSMKQLLPTMDSAEVNDAGITVAGSESHQQFQLVDSFELDEEKFVIVLKLLGGVGDKEVQAPVVARQKQTCSSCGTRNRGQNKFCRECGTALELI